MTVLIIIILMLIIFALFVTLLAFHALGQVLQSVIHVKTSFITTLVILNAHQEPLLMALNAINVMIPAQPVQQQKTTAQAAH